MGGGGERNGRIPPNKGFLLSKVQKGFQNLEVPPNFIKIRHNVHKLMLSLNYIFQFQCPYKLTSSSVWITLMVAKEKMSPAKFHHIWHCQCFCGETVCWWQVLLVLKLFRKNFISIQIKYISNEGHKSTH